MTQSILFWHSGTVPEAGYRLDAERRHMRLPRPKVTCRTREPAVLDHTHSSLNSALYDFCSRFKAIYAHLSLNLLFPNWLLKAFIAVYVYHRLQTVLDKAFKCFNDNIPIIID